MFKLFVVAAVLALANANALYGPGYAAPAVAAVPAVAHTSAVVGSAVVGHQVHSQVSYVPKVVSQPLAIVKPATYQISSGASIPATGKVIAAAPVLAAPAYGHAAPAYGHAAPAYGHAAPLSHY